MRRQSAGAISSTPPVGPATPALLTSASRPPSELSTSANRRATSASEATSALVAPAAGMRGAKVGEEVVGDVADMHARAARR